MTGRKRPEGKLKKATVHLMKTYCRAIVLAGTLAMLSTIVLWPDAGFAASDKRDSKVQKSDVPDDHTTIIYAGRILGDDRSTRVILDTDSKINVRVLHVGGPDRIVIETNRAVFKLPENDSLEARGIVSSVRYGAISSTRSRIVLTLASPGVVQETKLEPHGEKGRYRLIVDIGAVSAADFAGRVLEDQNKYGTSGHLVEKGDRVKRATKKKGRFSIVVDPGHGGIDTGATGRRGTKEKFITLMLARQIAEILRKAGPFDVYMTRDDDYFITLKERVAFAERKRADLFISIHADSLRQRSIRGATIYTLSRRASDKLAEAVASSENAVDLVAGLQAPKERDVVVDILAELTTRETMKFSHGLSNILVKTLGEKIKLIKNPQRSAAFGVLKAPEIPSVLIEMGYISNSRDEQLMKSDKWRKKVAEAIRDAVLQYFKPRMQALRGNQKGN